MTINFENYGRFYCALSYVDGVSIDFRNENSPHTLAEVAEFIELHMSRDMRCIVGIVCDWDTGEIVATINRDNEDFNYGEWDAAETDDECGFDPYLGCYTDDC